MPKGKNPIVSNIATTTTQSVVPKIEVTKRPTLLQSVIAALTGRGVKFEESDILITPVVMHRHMVKVKNIQVFVQDSRDLVNDLVRAIMRLLGISDSTTAVAA